VAYDNGNYTTAYQKLREAYKKVQNLTAALRNAPREAGTASGSIRKAIDELAGANNISLNLNILDSIFRKQINTDVVFGELKEFGSSDCYLICNSVPKSGTYLLLELIKMTDVFKDIHYQAYSNYINKVGHDGSLENPRSIPALMWAAALKPGTMCASHAEYCPILENHFLSSKNHKMITMIRDPRDLAISWVDFVYHSEAFLRMRAWHAVLRQAGEQRFQSDAEKIASSIDNLPGSGLLRYAAWVHSPACLTIRFEDLYGELTGASDETSAVSALGQICDYLAIPRRAKSGFVAALGRGLTSSGRADKIGIYKRRMNKSHLEQLRKPEFQKLVTEFGYSATV
jgi:hypothetical protein